MTQTAMPPAAVRPGPGIPWYLWCSALAVTSAYVGGYWDISWHRSIGRDSFWSPAAHRHLRLRRARRHFRRRYLIFTTTLGRTTPLREASVRIWGLSGPLGAFSVGLGRHRDAGVGAVRRLVAQRLRPRREDHQPAAHGAGHGILRHRVRHDPAPAGVHESRRRQRAADAAAAVSLRRRHGALRVAARQARIHRPARHALGVLLHHRRARQPGDSHHGRDRVASSDGRARSWRRSTRSSAWRFSGSSRSFQRSRSSGRSIARSRISSRGSFRCCSSSRPSSWI